MLDKYVMHYFRRFCHFDHPSRHRIEDALEIANIRYDRLDGTMKRDERIKAMDALKYDPGCEVLLVSLKAGGVGLNLTAAQRVYLMDPYWLVHTVLSLMSVLTVDLLQEPCGRKPGCGPHCE